MKAIEGNSSVLHPRERQTLRDAADAHLFSPNAAADPQCWETTLAAEALLEALVDFRDWPAELADRIRVDLALCAGFEPAYA
jgi:hypothetical protein